MERSSSGVPKPGWVATVAGASCVLSYAIATNASAHRVGLGFLKSYERMGRCVAGALTLAPTCSYIGWVHTRLTPGLSVPTCRRVLVECVHECKCDRMVLDGHHNLKISPYDLKYFTARVGGASVRPATAMARHGSMRCGLRLTVQNETSSGERKFKLTALFLNQASEALRAACDRRRRGGCLDPSTVHTPPGPGSFPCPHSIARRTTSESGSSTRRWGRRSGTPSPRRTSNGSTGCSARSQHVALGARRWCERGSAQAEGVASEPDVVTWCGTCSLDHVGSGLVSLYAWYVWPLAVFSGL